MKRELCFALPLLAACDPPPPASEPFNDAAIGALVTFDDDDPAELARAFEQLEDEIADELDLDGDAAARSLTPARLTDADVAGVDHPDRDPSLALPVALAARSAHPLPDHDRIALVADQVDIEPFADAYTRTFLSGEACFSDTCDFLRSSNAVVKSNPAMTVPFTLFKDWRAFELSDGRGARASRGWMEEGADGEDDKGRIEQSFAIELWTEQDDGTTLRLLVLWAETTFNPEQTDDAVQWSTRLGMDMLFSSHDDWIGEHPG
jgi:hypothetical protein